MPAAGGLLLCVSEAVSKAGGDLPDFLRRSFPCEGRARNQVSPSIEPADENGLIADVANEARCDGDGLLVIGRNGHSELAGRFVRVAHAIGAQIDPGWGVLAGHLVFLAVLVLRPQGLFGRPVRA